MASRTNFGGPLFRSLATLRKDRRDSLRGIFTDFSVPLEAP
jgi:hypothetical protein